MSSKLTLFSLITVLALASGCERRLDSPTDPDLDTADPPVPTSLTAAMGDLQVQLSWSISTPSLVSRYLIHRAETTAENFRIVDSAGTTAYTDAAVSNGVRYFYKVSARDLNGVAGASSATVSAVPTLFSVRINNDSIYTGSQNVRLGLTASGVSLMRIANDTTSPGAWEDFRATRDWVLIPGSGSKVVFVKFKTSAGVESVGWNWDEIVYDDRAEISSVSVSDSVLAPGDSMLVLVTTGETGGEATYTLSSRSNVELFDDGQGADAAMGDGIHSGVYVARTDDLFEHSTLSADFRDAAGNRATRNIAAWQISVRQPPPPAVWVALDPDSDNPTALNLSWTREDADPFAYLAMRRSTVSGQGLSVPITHRITSAGTATFRDTGLTANTRYYYTLEVVLSNGLTSLSAEDSGATSVDAPPDTVSLLLPSVLKYNEVSLEWTTSTVSDFSAYRLYRAQTPSVTTSSTLIAGFSSKSTTLYTDTTLSASSPYYYRVFVVDRAGQTTGSNELSIVTPSNTLPAPVTVAVSPTADSSLKLVWTESNDDDFATYRVYRSETIGAISTLPSDTLLVNILSDRASATHTEDGLTRSYYYRVFVFDRGGLSAGSNIVWGPKDFGAP
jgi:fibronectin type 3 domain-containing protein